MNKDKPHGGSTIDCDPSKAFDAAELVRRDFSALIRIFDEQLRTMSPQQSDRQLHLSQAKTAAERGLKLSEQLIEMLRESN